MNRFQLLVISQAYNNHDSIKKCRMKDGPEVMAAAPREVRKPDPRGRSQKCQKEKRLEMDTYKQEGYWKMKAQIRRGRRRTRHSSFA